MIRARFGAIRRRRRAAIASVAADVIVSPAILAQPPFPLQPAHDPVEPGGVDAELAGDLGHSDAGMRRDELEQLALAFARSAALRRPRRAAGLARADSPAVWRAAVALLAGLRAEDAAASGLRAGDAPAADLRAAGRVGRGLRAAGLRVARRAGLVATVAAGGSLFGSLTGGSPAR